MNELVVVFGGMEALVHARHGNAFEHVENQDGMVGRQGAAALGDDVGMWYATLVGGVDEGVDAVVDIFLDGIVDGTFGIAGARAVVVNAETASAIDKLDVEAHRMELHVELGGFAQGGGDAADFGDLRADVEVDELETVVKPHLIEQTESLEELGGVKAEL